MNEDSTIKFIKNVLLNGDNPRGEHAEENLRWGLREYSMAILEKELSHIKETFERAENLSARNYVLGRYNSIKDRY